LAAQLRAEALHRGRFADDRAIVEATNAAVNLARGAKADLTLIRALQVEAEVAAEAGDIAGAEAAGAQAEAVAAASGNPECQALARLTRGYCLMVEGQLEAAAEVFAEVAAALTTLGLVVELKRALNGLGICYTGVGRLKDAIPYFSRAIVIATKLGDRAAGCNLWTNLGFTFHEAGLFDSAGACYARANHFIPATSRTAVMLHSNATRLAIETGDIAEATHQASSALAAAAESGLWKLIVAAKLAKADLHVAQKQYEQAWPLVEESVALTGARVGLLSDSGQLARLYQHWIWKTRGYGAVLDVRLTGFMGDARQRLSDALQLGAFEDWMARVEGDTTRGSEFEKLTIQKGFFGILARLLALGVGGFSFGELSECEPSAALIVRVFRPQDRLTASLPPDPRQPTDVPLRFV
jgi:tetratricopeptide (TPR) repeat protein